MFFLGCIGYVMSGSGLNEILSIIYAPVSVEKMMNGHAYVRAVRGHLLVHLALGRIIMDNVKFSEDETTQIEEFLLIVDEGSDELNVDYQAFHTVVEKFEAELQRLEQNGPTAKLWVQYFRMVSLVKQFIEAERTGNWKLHLASIEKMLPFFHAAGHFNYALSGQLYLQDMYKLESWMSLQEYREYNDFVNKGYFTLRRSTNSGPECAVT